MSIVKKDTLLNEQVALAYNAGKAFADAGGKFSPDVQSIIDGSAAEVKTYATDEKTDGKFNNYSQRQIKNWENSKRIVVCIDENHCMKFVEKSKKDKQYNKKLYFGYIPSSLAEVIYNNTGINVEGYNFSISSNEIRKIFKDHGTDKTEAPRGQRAVEERDIANIPNIILAPSSVERSKRDYDGKPAIEFTGESNGNMTIVAVVSDQHLDLRVQTAYIGKKRGNLAVPTDANPLPLTSETAHGTVSSISSIPNSSRNVKKGGVVYEESVDKSKLSDKQKAQIKYIEVVAAVTGVEIHLFQSGLDGDGNYNVPYNGKFSRENNTIYIDVNAGKQGENIGDYALTRTLSHELTHFIRMNAPQEYMVLMRFCFQKIGMDEFNRLTEGRMAKNESLDFEDAIEEVVASGCEMMLRDSRVIEQLAKENRSLAEKILNFLKDFAEKVKEAFSGVNAVSDEAKLLESHTEELVALWDNALKKAVQNNTSAEDTSAMGDMAAQNSAAETQQDVSDSQQNAKPSEHKNIPEGAKPKGKDLSDYLDEDDMFEVRGEFSNELQEWFDTTTHEERKVSGKRFLVGITTDVLKSIGVRDYNIYFGGSKIDKILTDNASMTLGVIKQSVSLLENPILVMQSQTVEDSIVLFGEVYTESNKPVMISVLLEPKTKSGEVLDYAVITSSYGRRKGNLQNLINSSKIYYVCDQKNRTDKWLKALGLQLPSALTKYGPINSISDSAENSNTFSENNSDIIKEDRTAELTDEQIIERRLKTLKTTDPEFRNKNKTTCISQVVL